MTQYKMPSPELTPITTCTAVLRGSWPNSFFSLTVFYRH
jgi:hypothetical protein